MRSKIAVAILVAGLATGARASHQASPDWNAAEAELIRHFQAVVRMDTTDPPGGERPVVDYLKKVLTAEGIEVREFALEPDRPNLVARLKGNGSRRPLLLMAHTDTVNIDEKKWTSAPPFSALQKDGYIYGRGTVDDKDNVAASLMVMLLLKRLNVPLDRDVIFLAEAGEEGSVRVGIKYMVEQQYGAIEAEYCLAEGGNGYRKDGQVRFLSVQTLEKIPYAIELVARGPAGHGSVPLETNAVARVAQAVAKVAAWTPPVRLNETTSAYFKRLASLSPPDEAARYRAVLDPKRIAEIDAYFRTHEPRHASMLRTSVSPNIIQAGYRINVIPSEAIATLDVRGLQDENMPAFLEAIRKVVDDPAVEVRMGARDTRPGGVEARIDSEVFRTLEATAKTHYNVPVLPTMSTGATDMAYLRAKGMQCYGVGPATDVEDGPLGFAAHSDQERILESELRRFMRFYWDAVTGIARARTPAVSSATSAASSASAPNWPQFRGPGAAGLADGLSLPLSWSKSSNVSWVADIPGRGWSSPIVVGDRVFVTTAINDGGFKEPSTGIFGNDYAAELTKQGLPPAEVNKRVIARDIELADEIAEVRYMVYALDARTGHVLWEREAHKGKPSGGRHRKNTYASETPASDGERIYASFGGNVGLFAFTLDGRPLWSHRWDPQPIYLDFGTAASPVVHGGRVYHLRDTEKESTLTALDARTGKVIWNVARPVVASRSQSGWSTPFIWETPQRTELVTIGKSLVVSYSLDGTELWRMSGMTQATPTAVAGGGLLFVGSGSQGEANRPMFAIRPGATGDISVAAGATPGPFIAWMQPRLSGYTPSPLFYRGQLYVVNDNGVMQVVDAATGEEVYRARVGGVGNTFSSSPIASGGRIYALSEDGDTFVFEAGRGYVELAKNSLEEMSLASPAATPAGLFVRTQTRLYRIAAPRAGSATSSR